MVLLALFLGGCVASEGDGLDVDALAYVAPPDCAKARSDDRVCLACNIYFESRGEPLDGQLMVGRVHLNRVHSERFPESVCGVLWQRGQFSWTFDRNHKRPREKGGAWKNALIAADKVLQEKAEERRKAHPYLYFHATYIRKQRRGASRVIGGHVFFAG